jgi:hypothetical protein
MTALGWPAKARPVGLDHGVERNAVLVSRRHQRQWQQ